MNKRLMVAIIIAIFISVIVSGCGLDSESEVLMDDVSHIEEIPIAKSTAYNKFNNDFFMTLQSAEESRKRPLIKKCSK